MEKKVLLTELVDRGSHLRKEITPTAVVTDEGKHAAGTFWDANKTINEIVAGASSAQDTLKEVEDKLNKEIQDARAAEQAISDRIDDVLGIDAEGIADLKQAIEDLDPETGILSVIDNKTDKVDSATSGNFAALDANGNLTDSGHKHSDYITQHLDLSDYVQKSQTTGLLKNDGTVDTNTYLTLHLDISGKANVSHTHTTADVTDLIEHIDHTNNVEYVDLGLPSGKLWAKYNVGASEDYALGTYFQWGSTSAYEGTDNYYTGTLSTSDILPLANDTARLLLGGDWRMPTKEDWDELFANTDIYYGGPTLAADKERNIYYISCYSKKAPYGYIMIPLPGTYNSSTGTFYTDDFYLELGIYPSSNVKSDGTPICARIANGIHDTYAVNTVRNLLYCVRGILDVAVEDKNKYILSSEKGANDGITPLKSDGKIDDRYIPSKYNNLVYGYYYDGNFYSITPYSGITAPAPDSTKIIVPETGKFYFDWETYSIFIYTGTYYYKVKSNGGPVKTGTDTNQIQTPDPYYAYIITLTDDLNASNLVTSYDFGNGNEIRVIFTADSQHTVTINHNATWAVCPDATNLTLTIPAGGFREVTFMRANNKTYVIPNKY